MGHIHGSALVFIAISFTSAANAWVPDSDLRMTQAATGQEWNLVEGEASKDAVVQMLSTAGWESGQIEGQLKEADSFELFSKPISPGVVSYLAVPNGGMNSPIEFSAAQGAVVTPAMWGSPSADEIRKEITDGMQAAIEALCDMKARPNTIRAKASAFGIVEVEATWDAGDVCAP